MSLPGRATNHQSYVLTTSIHNQVTGRTVLLTYHDDACGSDAGAVHPGDVAGQGRGVGDEVTHGQARVRQANVKKGGDRKQAHPGGALAVHGTQDGGENEKEENHDVVRADEPPVPARSVCWVANVSWDGRMGAILCNW